MFSILLRRGKGCWSNITVRSRHWVIKELFHGFWGTVKTIVPRCQGRLLNWHLGTTVLTVPRKPWNNPILLPNTLYNGYLDSLNCWLARISLGNKTVISWLFREQFELLPSVSGKIFGTVALGLRPRETVPKSSPTPQGNSSYCSLTAMK